MHAGINDTVNAGNAVEPVALYDYQHHRLDFGDRRIVLRRNGIEKVTECRVLMLFNQGVPSVVLRISIDADVGELGRGRVGKDVEFQIGTSSRWNKGYLSMDGGDGCEPVYVVFPKHLRLEATETFNQIACATAHIFNFPSILGPGSYQYRKVVGARVTVANLTYLNLTCNTFVAVVAGVADARPVSLDLIHREPKKLSHMVHIRKKDWSLCDGKAAEEHINIVRQFLSFCAGKWGEIGGLYGFDDQSRITWEVLGCSVSSGESVASPNWLPPFSPSLIEALFPGFVELVERLSATRMHEIVHGYVEANTSVPGKVIDLKITLALSCLDRLSQSLPGKPLGSVFERVKSLSDRLGFCCELGNEHPELLRCYQGGKDSSFIRAMVDIRNDYIHVKKRCTNISGWAKAETLNSALWLIEMCILRLSKYSGQYRPRTKLKHGDPFGERVPWENVDDSIWDEGD